jgi:hypothetical protein
MKLSEMDPGLFPFETVDEPREKLAMVVFVYDEPYDVYIGRGRDPMVEYSRSHGTILTGKPGDYGNPWTHKKSAIAEYQVETAEEAVAKFREYVLAHPELQERIRRELRGKTLGCWCSSKRRKSGVRTPCHGDVLIEVANS